MNTAPAPTPQIGSEYPPPGEDAVLRAIADLQTKITVGTAQATHTAPRRGQHAKTHGCVAATFAVLPDLPTEFQVGLFRTPRSYDALVRFSNGKSDDDAEPDIHGLAIKVLGVSGPKALPEDTGDAQDFIFIDSEAFFAPCAATLFGFMQALVLAQLRHSQEPIAAFAAADPRHRAVVERVARMRKSGLPSPLGVPYWSAVPYRFGDGAAKYAVHPVDTASVAPPGTPPADYLREAMVEHLTRRRLPASFDFFVQRQTDAAAMPVEDPTVPWASPPVKVATLTIAPQEFDTPELRSRGEAAVFSPWHALAEHRPIGGINRARRLAYAESARLRLGRPAG